MSQQVYMTTCGMYIRQHDDSEDHDTNHDDVHNIRNTVGDDDLAHASATSPTGDNNIHNMVDDDVHDIRNTVANNNIHNIRNTVDDESTTYTTYATQ